MRKLAYLLDANLWIALVFTEHAHHEVAEQAVASALQTGQVVFCRATEQSFLRLATTPAILRAYKVHGRTNRDMLSILAGLKAFPGVIFLEEPTGIAPCWHRLATRDTASPQVWMDAYLAAFSITGNLTLVTFDTDFCVYQKEGLQLMLLKGNL